MKFQLLKLIIWPKNIELPPRIVKFQPGKANVITGSSRTGKSAIIPIIDYCLASSDCSVPIGCIRNTASWYSIVFQTDTEQIFIARKVPTGNSVSSEFHLIRNIKEIMLPAFLTEANETIDGIKNILNTISNVPYFSLNTDENQAYNARLGFRDLMALVFQNQDIIANQNILFYKTHKHAHRERLRNWFPFILGAENLASLQARQTIQFIEKKILLLQKELNSYQEVSFRWAANIENHIKTAAEYGLISNSDITIDPINSNEMHITEKNLFLNKSKEKAAQSETLTLTPLPAEEYIAGTDNNKLDSLLATAKHILENIPDYSQTRIENIYNSSKELLNFQKDEYELSSKIGITQKRLQDVARLKIGIQDYGNSLQKRANRLQISKWFDGMESKNNSCPFCGSEEHPNAKIELSKATLALERYEHELKKLENIPTSFIREENNLKLELNNLLEKQKSLHIKFNNQIKRDKKASEEFQRSKNMFIFLGHFKSSLENFENLSGNNKLKDELLELDNQHKELLKLIDPLTVKKQLAAATKFISQGTLRYLSTLDVDEKYKKVSPHFNVTDLNISILSEDDHSWHILAEVGSASNWVSFHLALICALHEYCLNLGHSCVPSFAIFDQPSQVYFPRIPRDKEIVDHNYIDADIDAVKKIFQTLGQAVINSNGQWQSIILDHADIAIYNGIPGIHEVEVWRNGIKLIPHEWINQ